MKNNLSWKLPVVSFHYYPSIKFHNLGQGRITADKVAIIFIPVRILKEYLLENAHFFL